MAKIVHGLTSAFLALTAVACGSGDLTANGVEPIDCTQDDAYALTPVVGGLHLSVQDKTFPLKDELRPEGAFVSGVKLAKPRCPPAGDDTAHRIWTVSEYTRWGQGLSVEGAVIGGAAAQYKGISFWAKALVDAPKAELDAITFTDDTFVNPQEKADMSLETPADVQRRLPKPISASGVMRLSVATSGTQLSPDKCWAPTPVTPPPLQVQDGSDECYDAFTVAFYPNERWTFFTFPFVEMRQSGWGKPVNFLDSGDIGAVELTVGPFAKYDVLIDGISYYNHALPPQ